MGGDQRRGGAHAPGCLSFFVRRTFQFPMLDSFDPSESDGELPERLETTVPAQALTLLNSQIALTQSQEFARRLLKECGNHPEKYFPCVADAFNRPISKMELERSADFLRHRETATGRSHSTEGAQPLSVLEVL